MTGETGEAHTHAYEIEIEKLSQDLGDAYEQLTLIYKTVRHLGASFELETIARQLVERATESLTSADAEAALFLRNLDGAFQFIAGDEALARSIDSNGLKRFGNLKAPTFFTGPIASALQTGSSQREHLLASPLEAGGHLVGLLILARVRGARFTTVESKLLGALCSVTAVAVANWQHYNAIQHEREMLEGVIREIGDGIVVSDARWHARMTNPAAASFLSLGTETSDYDVVARLQSFATTIDLETLRRGELPSEEFTATSTDPRRPLVLSVSTFRARLGASSEPVLVLRMRDTTREHIDAEAQRDFMSLASHKLRTPLTKILGLLPLLADGCESDRERMETIQGIESGASELSRLVDGVLEFVEYRRGNTARESLDFAAIVTHAVAEVERARPNRSAIDLVITSELPPVIGSPRMLERMVFNLIDNAVKFGRGSDEPVRVELSAIGHERLRLTIEDHGEGIAPELVKRLFHPFSQRDLGFTGQDEGAGLGLLLAREAANLHAGSITAESKLGIGSRFVVEIATNQDPQKST